MKPTSDADRDSDESVADLVDGDAPGALVAATSPGAAAGLRGVATEAPVAAPPPSDPRPALIAMSMAMLVDHLAAGGFPAFRARQVWHWLQVKCVRSIDEMVNVSKEVRAYLAESTRLGGIRRIVAERSSADGSTKFLAEFADGRRVESVLMPGVGTDSSRMTLCLSSQVGCAVDCQFCVTGRNGFFRQMTVDEILDQVRWARRWLAQRNDGRLLRNIVFMGMGEPLLNTAAVIPALRLITDPTGLDFSPKRVTVSTSGILPGLRELHAADLDVSLAVSLNAPTQELRAQIMPISKRWPLDELLAFCRALPHGRRRITFEYVLLAGLNDSPTHARQVVKCLHGIPSKVNVIPFNPDPSLPWQRPDNATVEAFCEVLRAAHLTTSVRWSKALDVNGACGQLAGQFREREKRTK